MIDGTADGHSTLGAEMRDVARARILRGARTVLAKRGLNATVDEVAEAAGVSRRTVFRYFATHGQLFEAAMAEIWQIYGQQLPPPPARDEDVDEWLTATAITLHTLNANVVGRAFWDIYMHHLDAGSFAPTVAASIEGRQRFISRLTRDAWRCCGGTRQPPPWLADAFSLQLSAFATHGYASGHPGRSPEDIGRLSAKMLSTLLRAALAERQR